jgi:hypothetical protein
MPDRRFLWLCNNWSGLRQSPLGSKDFWSKSISPTALHPALPSHARLRRTLRQSISSRKQQPVLFEKRGGSNITISTNIIHSAWLPPTCTLPRHLSHLFQIPFRGPHPTNRRLESRLFSLNRASCDYRYLSHIPSRVLPHSRRPQGNFYSCVLLETCFTLAALSPVEQQRELEYEAEHALRC